MRQPMEAQIVIDPQVHFGKPCVAGTRITVQNVLELLKQGRTFDDLKRDYYPDLTTEDIQACLQYAMDVTAVEDVHLASAAA